MTPTPSHALHPGDIFTVDDTGEEWRVESVAGFVAVAVSESTGARMEWVGGVEVVK